MKFDCCDPFRRNATAAHATLNGLDWLDVLDRDLPPDHPLRQRTLLLHLLKPAAGLDRGNLLIRGGDRIRDVAIEWAAPAQPLPPQLTPAEAQLVAALPDADRVLVIRTDSSGDKSDYVLQLVRSALDTRVPAGFDPQLAEIRFSFKVECPSEFDCRNTPPCPEDDSAAPPINYLAKDYASFRRLLLDRISQLIPDQRGRSAADTGVALAELLAYVGDQLSYRQDAAATEAYLGTARERISLRRHALLVDYRMHDGCNARCWVHVRASAAGGVLLPAQTRFLTECRGSPVRLRPDSPELERALRLGPEVFEPLHALTLYPEHNEIHFYTWGDRRCCLPCGSTRATLRGHLSDLAPGDALLLEEVAGPESGLASDADPQHRHVVRLVEVVNRSDGEVLVDPLDGTPITEVAWHADDALPFPLCISAVSDKDHGNVYNGAVSVARGNLVAVDHGHSVGDDAFDPVPAATLFYAAQALPSRCESAAALAARPRYRPALARAPLTQAEGFDANGAASALLRRDIDQARPQLSLLDSGGSAWQARRDLLSSNAAARDFVVETDAQGRARLRFGDDVNGRFPVAGTAFRARYRVGNGAAGNVGAEAIGHVVTIEPDIRAVRNPLPASGGVDAEDGESVRRRAPMAFRRQERAVTEADYAEVTTRQAAVQNAAATLRWTGSWHSVFVTVDRDGGSRLDSTFKAALATYLDRYRMAGHDLALREPVFVPLELALHVCVEPGHFRSDVRLRLLELFSARALRNGGRGLFHADNFSFGQSVYLSPLYAAAHGVPGVQSAQITVFRRQGSKDTLALKEGRISLGRLEIARLDNDANFPERGVLRLDLHGGK